MNLSYERYHYLLVVSFSPPYGQTYVEEVLHPLRRLVDTLTYVEYIFMHYLPPPKATRTEEIRTGKSGCNYESAYKEGHSKKRK